MRNDAKASVSRRARRSIRLSVLGLGVALSLAISPIALGQNGDDSNANGGGDVDLSDGEVELRPTTVLGEETSGDDLVGPYGQPAWTARQQRFGTTRAYVLPPNTYEFEVFSVTTLDGDEKEYEFLEELKIGLPHRFQFDIYATQVKGPNQDVFHGGEFKFELRWALDEWGEIPLNPTAYVEYETAQNEDENGMEYKLLLAENFAPRWQWAGNLIFEDSLSEDKIEYGFSSGINYELSNQWGLGAEAEVIWEEEDGNSAEASILVGPSIEWRPSARTSLRVAPLFGIGSDSPDMEIFAIFGIGFGGPNGGGEGLGPGVSEVR